MSIVTAVRERPILFSAPMVRAILDGRKTQTRRVVTKHTSEVGTGLPWSRLDWARIHVDPGFGDGQYLKVGGPDETYHRVRCRWIVGDQLWVRETWFGNSPGGVEPETFHYRATEPGFDVNGKSVWRPSILMPRAASRLTLEITDIRVERVQEITEEGAGAEGIGAEGGHIAAGDLRGFYRAIWNNRNAKRGFGWDVNPWVWAVSFRRSEPAIRNTSLTATPACAVS